MPIKKKIVYLSRQQNTIPLDFQLIAAEVEQKYPDYQNVFLVKMVPDGLAAKIGYCFYILKQMYHLATAEAAILDTYSIPICMLKQRESLRVIQIWHALGAFKKFSFSILDQEEGRSSATAAMMHMHENYTWVLTSSEYCRPFFREAFGVRDDQMKVIPLPRADYIRDPYIGEQIREKIYRAYPRLKNTQKKILVYAPTFRKYEVDFNCAVQKLVEQLDFEKYELIVKLHPLSEAGIEDRHVIFDRLFPTHEIFRIADAVIADYSAVIFEAALLKLPLYFYTFDLDEYLNKRNFYLDYRTMMPGPISENAQELITDIENDKCDRRKVEAFCNLMIETGKKKSAERIADLAITGIDPEK